MQIALRILLLIVGFVMLVKGADWFVEGAAAAAKKLGVSQLIIGLTIVAMGTSLPEAAVSITSALSGSAGITVGNVVGSNIMNILVILGITGAITRVAVAKSTIRYEIPFVVLITVILLVFGYTGNQITRVEGIIFWILFLVYLGYLFVMSRKHPDEEGGEEVKDLPVWKCILFILAGGIMVVWGSDFVVDAASYIARAAGISERIIGLTIVAFGTSLPELVTSTTAAIKKDAGIAIGNIVGSNIFNILFVTGTTALIINVPFEAKFVVDTIAAIAAAVILWLCVIRRKELGRTGGIAMLCCYVAYFVYLCLN